MKLLLDSVTFLDAGLAAKDLSSKARSLLLDSENELYVSIVSFWEIAIKYSIGKLDLPSRPEDFLIENRVKLGTALLSLDEESVLHLPRLPRLHADPFDRMLICQAIVHGMVLVTSDKQIPRYPVRTAW
jgi:PIN domain nuclease of toxin-antitoxin system